MNKHNHTSNMLWLCGKCFFLMIRRPPRSTRTDTLFPYTTLFRSSELEVRGQTILGGDVEFSLPQRQATVEEMAGFRRVGTPSATVRLRAMANDPDGEALPSELKAVDGAYPLYGPARLGRDRRSEEVGKRGLVGECIGGRRILN